MSTSLLLPAVLSSPPTLKQRVKAFLRTCENWWDAETYQPGDQFLRNLGTVGSATDLRFGSSTGVDSGDPTGLKFDGVPYFQLPGSSGDYLSVPDSATLSITGDIDMRWWGALNNWGLAAEQTLVSKYATTGGGRSYRLLLNSGQIILYISGDGTTAVQAGFANLPTLTDGSTYCLRVTRSAATGATEFSYAAVTRTEDQPTFLPIAGGASGAAGSIFDSSAQVELGGYNSATAGYLSGKVYRAQIRNNILDDGTGIVLDVSAAGVPSNAASFTCATGQTVTVNRATSGHKTAIVPATALRLGQDDKLLAPYHASFDPGLGDFTALIFGRQWETPVNYSMLLAHRDSGGTYPGWFIANIGTTKQTLSGVADAASQVAPNGATYAAGEAIMEGFQVDRSASRIHTISKGTLQASGILTAVGSITASAGLCVGGEAFGNGQTDFEFRGAVVTRQKFTAQQLADIAAFYRGVLV